MVCVFLDHRRCICLVVPQKIAGDYSVALPLRPSSKSTSAVDFSHCHQLIEVWSNAQAAGKASCHAVRHIGGKVSHQTFRPTSTRRLQCSFCSLSHYHSAVAVCLQSHSFLAQNNALCYSVPSSVAIQITVCDGQSWLSCGTDQRVQRQCKVGLDSKNLEVGILLSQIPSSLLLLVKVSLLWRSTRLNKLTAAGT